MGPVSNSERIQIIDILRGWALFGIIVADFDILFRPPASTDLFVMRLHGFLFVEKFWPLFSFLFGLGFALKMVRSERRGGGFMPLYLRRLIVLLLFGVANKLLLLHGWRGDILHAYAILGFVLLLFRHSSIKMILVAISIFVIIPQSQQAILGLRHERPMANSAIATEVNQEAARQVRGPGNYREQLAHTIERLRWRILQVSRYYWWVGGILPMFLLGLCAGRRGIFENLTAHRPLFRKILWWGLGLGLVGNFADYVLSVHIVNPHLLVLTHFLVGMLVAVGNPALSFCYAGCIVLLAQTGPWLHRLAPLAAAGRMALSNYLLQSVAFAVLCPKYGLGFGGSLAPVAAMGLAVFIFLLQLMFSVWWIGRFRFGPAEWLWRSLTYNRLQPMRA